MSTYSRATLSGTIAHCTAERHGRHAGRAGLSVEEVADTGYLVRLRRDTEEDLLAMAADLERELADLDVTGDPVLQEVLVERARAKRAVRIADYELLCATFGRSWRRHHRDRHFAHIGWRCPRLGDRHDERRDVDGRGSR
jgi:hypothetical protein